MTNKAVCLLALLLSAVARRIGAGSDEDGSARRGCRRQAGHARVHQDPRDGGGGQSRRQRRRARCARVPAAELWQEEKSRRYPVVYALHGYSIGAEQWSHEIHAPQTIEGAFASGAKEMIVVLPDSKTLHNGSMYSGSVTTGDFENFIARDVVSYIDAHYRTIPERRSRGLAGHSMGGYGATRIGMKHADVFGSLYIMSPCCLSPRSVGPANAEMSKALEEVKSPADSAKLPFFARAQLAAAAAWSPNPKNPPLFLDLPTQSR